nr:general odorant-binding protein 56a-like [Onthophagus taurus]XP_022913289.1 general odorant-binding protein 56a-like [Onthophagus taurus]
MKILGLTFLLIVSVSSKDKLTHEELQKFREECVKQTGVNDELITKADDGDFADTKELMCFSKCFYDKLGYLKEDGSLDWDVVKEIFADDKTHALPTLEACRDRKGKSACETTYLIHKCYFLASQKILAESEQNAKS